MVRHATTCALLVFHRPCDCRPMNPECQQGKHQNCDGNALVGDDVGTCGCLCHGQPGGPPQLRATTFPA